MNAKVSVAQATECIYCEHFFEPHREIIMYIGSSSDPVYALIKPKVSNDQFTREEAQTPASFGTLLSNEAGAAALTARLAQSGFDRADTNMDGKVERDEYIDSRMNAGGVGFKPELQDVINSWNDLDKSGKGVLSEDEFKQAHSSIMKVSVGHLNGPLR